MKVSFIGLGVMGYPMAGHLARAGHQVCVYNRTSVKAQQWVAEHDNDGNATTRQPAPGCGCAMRRISSTSARCCRI